MSILTLRDIEQLAEVVFRSGGLFVRRVMRSGARVAALSAALAVMQLQTAEAFDWRAGADESGGIPVGAGEFEVDVPRGPVTVYTYRPAAATADSPIWIVMHGVRRDVRRHIAADYYDTWERLAERYGAVLLVPEFTEVKWPTFWNYTLGNIRTPGLRPIPWSHSSFHVVEQAFRQAVAMTGSRQRKFSIFGHGAGAQFVQRYVLHSGGRHIHRAVAANPGWYMLPDDEYRFPYGLRDAAVAPSTLRAAFASDFILLLGQSDVNSGGGLRNDPEAVAQGRNRYDRGHFYFERSRAVAARMGAGFRWRIEEVPGVGHEFDRMSPDGAALLAGAAASGS